MSTNHFRMSYPAARGEMVLQGHADACAEYGHAAWVIDGVTQPRCPRCGETTATEAEIEAYTKLLKETAAAEDEERRIRELMRNTLELSSTVTGKLARGSWYVQHTLTGRIVRWPGETGPASWANNRSAVLSGFDYARELATESGDAYELLTGAEVIEAFGKVTAARNAETVAANQAIADADAAARTIHIDPESTTDWGGGVEYTYKTEGEAHSVRREFIGMGRKVSLIGYDDSRRLYTFDVRNP